MRIRSSQGLAIATLLVLAACQNPEPLTAAKADQILRGYMFAREPVYAEVPQRVWWDERHPKDDFDDKSLRTFKNLERAGYVTVSETHDNHGAIYVAKVTQKGFPILGTSPSLRGPAFRGMICYKKYDGIRNFDLSLFKVFAPLERLRVQFRVEALVNGKQVAAGQLVLNTIPKSS